MMYGLAWSIELAHRLVNPYYRFAPFLTRAEVLKVSVTHYFDPAKPRDELAYRPLVSPDEGVRRMVTYFGKEHRDRVALQSSTVIVWWVRCALLMLGLALLWVYLR
jgi:hypothetical protein